MTVQAYIVQNVIPLYPPVWWCQRVEQGPEVWSPSFPPQPRPQAGTSSYYQWAVDSSPLLYSVWCTSDNCVDNAGLTLYPPGPDLAERAWNSGGKKHN